MVDERLRFIAKLLDGESMTHLCREFGISRKTGYKIFSRYNESGFEALSDRCRRPVRYANQLPPQIEHLIVGCKREKPHWGARKTRELLVRRLDQDVRIPAKSTIHAVLHRHGLVKGIGPAASSRNRHRALRWRSAQRSVVRRLQGRVQAWQRSALLPAPPSPTTLRAICSCAKRWSPREDTAITAFEQLFLERGLPSAIRSDNGVPFASLNALFNLSKLAVWWLRLGIAIERIKPGRPQQNGRDERMHLTLKKEATRPPGMNSLQQQARFDAFVGEFNDERPHEALAMKTPAELYAASPRPYQGLPDISYPLHDRDVVVTACGRKCMHRKRINLSHVVAGQRVGIREVDDGIWIVTFMHYDLGYRQPVRPEVFTYVLGTTC